MALAVRQADNMATKRKVTRKGKKLHGKRKDPVLVATILAYARKETFVAASERFGVANRSIRRYQQLVNSGKWPEVAKLLEQMQEEVRARCADLLTEGWEVTLRRVIDISKTMTPEQAIRAVEVLGNLKITKESLSDPDGSDSAGQGAP